MKTSDDLFHLIKSLSKTEKGYFKKFTGLHGQKNDKLYLRLFDAIDEQDHYDETALKRKFAGENIVRQFSSAKNYLYTQVLRSLQAFAQKETVHAKIREAIAWADILQKRGLDRQSQKTLQKARKLNGKVRNTSLALDILGREKIHLNAELDALGPSPAADTVFARMQELHDEALVVLERARAFKVWVNFSDRFRFLYLRFATARSEADENELRAFMAQPELASRPERAPFNAQIQYYEIHTNFCHFIGDTSGHLKYARAAVALFDTCPDPIGQELKTSAYSNTLWNLTLAQVNAGLFTEAEQTIRRLEGLAEQNHPSMWDSYRDYLRYMAKSLDLLVFARSGEFEKAYAFSREFTAQQAQYTSILDDSFLFGMRYCCALACFITDRAAEALAKLQALRIDSEGNLLRQDIQLNVRVLLIIIYYELGERDVLDSQLRSLYRLLLKKKRLFRFEQALIEYIRKLQTVVTPQDEKRSFRTLLAAMEKLQDDPYDRKAFEYFDIIAWLHAKLENRPLIQVARERIQNRTRTAQENDGIGRQ